ncbi:MAG: tRNA (guanosine(37)-N1)-methyltransferase TrmD [Chlamydiota bacterium]
MRIDILSLFPEYFISPFSVSIIERAIEKGIISINQVNIRDFSKDKNKRVDDRPFGGGPGMVLAAPPVVDAIRSVKTEETHVVYLSPQGSLLSAKKCEELSKKKHIVLLFGHYEGTVERAVAEVNEEISIGDYVLTNVCVSAIVLVDAMIRFIPGVLGHPDAAFEDSFQEGIFDSPHFTRPLEFEGLEVPAVLRGGNHEEIRKWRKEQGLKKTRKVRPDLYEDYLLAQQKVKK